MSYKVELYIYDLTQGMAKQFAPMLAPGLQIDGVWHTAIVVYGTEWFYGGGGIERCAPGTTMMGPPLKIKDLGMTSVSPEVFNDYLRGLGRSEYAGSRYELFRHNCNDFTDTVSRFLVGVGIPQYILDLPKKVLNSPLAQMLGPIIQNSTPHGETAVEKEEYSHIPVIEFKSFNGEIDVEKMVLKVEELNEKNGKSSPLTKEEIDSIKNSLKENKLSAIWPILRRVLNSWPPSDVFPFLDVIRRISSQRFDTDEKIADEIYLLLEKFIGRSEIVLFRLILKIFCNYFLHDFSKVVIIKQRESLIGKINSFVESLESLDSQSQTVIATLCLNFAVYYQERRQEEASFQIISAMTTIYLPMFDNPEATYRATVAFGTFLHGDRESKDLAVALDAEVLFSKLIEKYKSSSGSKLTESLAQCTSILKS